MLSVEQLFKERLLTLPRFKEVKPAIDLLKGNGAFNRVGGVYVFYNEYEEPLYVGISDNVNRRVKAHLTGRGSKDLKRYNVGKLKVAVFYESNVAYREIYESYLIETLQPRFNVAKTGRVRL